MQKWVDNVKSVEDERIKLVIVTANNHYAGFGPRSGNIFRNMLGLPQAEWKEMKEAEKQEQYTAPDSKQSTLSEFLS